MTINRLNEIIDSFEITNVDKFKLLELIYVLRAWELLSKDEEIKDESLKYYTFINNKIDVSILKEIFNKLSTKIKLFDIYKLDIDNLDNEVLYLVINQINDIKILPKISDAFFFSKFKIDTSSVSNQIAELGIKLIDPRQVKYEVPFFRELYVPFTQGFAYANYMRGHIYADGQISKYSLVAELITVCELAKGIEFNVSNSLENPIFLDNNEPSNLRKFGFVLSFPPFSLKQKVNFEHDKYNRFHFQKGSVLDVAHFEHILAQTDARAVVLMPVGFTFRSGSEELFRKYLIDKNYLEGIIQLPPNIHSATSIETTFFIINKYKREEKRVMFINLKNENFIKRDGRQLVFKSVDEIIDIYSEKKELINISSMISQEEIVENNYSFAIDRYIVPEKTREVQQKLEKYELIELDVIADIKKSQLFKDEENGLELYELSPSNFNRAGFTVECGKVKKIESQKSRLDTYKLESYDVLLSTKGTIGKVAIIGEIDKPVVASQASLMIRLKDENKKAKAICLYMYLKSNIGQSMLSQLVSGAAMPQISTSEIKKLQIPILSENESKKVLLNFYNEIEMYNKITLLERTIQQLHNNFLGNK